MMLGPERGGRGGRSLILLSYCLLVTLNVCAVVVLLEAGLVYGGKELTMGTCMVDSEGVIKMTGVL